MKLKSILSMLTLAGTSLLAVGPVGATTNLFVPITGSAFVPVSGTVSYNQNGLCQATFTNQQITASLGHAQGGANNFTVYYYNPGQGNTITCNVNVKQTGNLALNVVSFQGSTSVGGHGNFVIATNPVGADSIYSIGCMLPVNAGIYAVVPNH